MARGNCTIRPATKADAPQVAEVWGIMAAQHRAYDPEVWSWGDDAVDRWRETFENGIEDPDRLAYVAENTDGTIAGFSQALVRDKENIYTPGRVGHVWDLCIRPGYRRLGLGRKLMDATFEAMKQRGADEVILHVAEDNPAALKLYENMGMKTIMRRMHKRL